FKEKFNNVIVYDINGKKVYKTNIGLSNTALMNLTFLKNGIYAIKILKDNKQLGIMKFVKGE
ncbi:MAG TPA: T9SS type A sorting domain-containing protein, partial [Bacteroidetes bacterium]|nr:T9SS type A sorting domain-containing protein [Bacteroidota bacterium]